MKCVLQPTDSRHRGEGKEDEVDDHRVHATCAYPRHGMSTSWQAIRHPPPTPRPDDAHSRRQQAGTTPRRGTQPWPDLKTQHTRPRAILTGVKTCDGLQQSTLHRQGRKAEEGASVFTRERCGPGNDRCFTTSRAVANARSTVNPPAAKQRPRQHCFSAWLNPIPQVCNRDRCNGRHRKMGMSTSCPRPTLRSANPDSTPKCVGFLSVRG